MQGYTPGPKDSYYQRWVLYRIKPVQLYVYKIRKRPGTIQTRR